MDVRQQESTIDLSRPPKVAYTHQEYPRLMYHQDGRVLAVENELARSMAEELGYVPTAFPARDYTIIRNGSAPALSVEEVEEEPKRRPGRPRKAE